MKLIQLTDSHFQKIWVNVDHIDTIHDAHGGKYDATGIYMSNGRLLLINGRPQDIVDLVADENIALQR